MKKLSIFCLFLLLIFNACDSVKNPYSPDPLEPPEPPKLKADIRIAISELNISKTHDPDIPTWFVHFDVILTEHNGVQVNEGLEATVQVLVLGILAYEDSKLSGLPIAGNGIWKLSVAFFYMHEEPKGISISVTVKGMDANGNTIFVSEDF